MRSSVHLYPRDTRTGWVFSVILFMIVLSFGAAVEAVEVGDHAPDFRLPSTKAHPVSLSGFLGKKYVVLEFYVLDFTPT